MRNEHDPAEVDSLERITDEIVACRKCPRLVAWREQVARDKRAAYRDEDYWARPVPGFGDPHASLLIVGLAPAAHGGNRTGRIFTGDRSGDWLFGALYRAGYANQPTSAQPRRRLATHRRLHLGMRALRTARQQADARRARHVPAVSRPRAAPACPTCSVIVCLGKFAYDGLATLVNLKRRPAFGHGVEAPLPDGRTVLCSFHPSQQNTFTGKLTVPMFDAIFARARELVMKNREVATVLRELADTMELLGEDRYRVADYRDAATRVEHHYEPIEIMARRSTASSTFHGIGKSIGTKIVEYLDTGTLEALEERRPRIPEAALRLMHISGIGPKRAMQFTRELHVQTVADLQASLDSGQVAALPDSARRPRPHPRGAATASRPARADCPWRSRCPPPRTSSTSCRRAPGGVDRARRQHPPLRGDHRRHRHPGRHYRAAGR